MMMNLLLADPVDEVRSMWQAESRLFLSEQIPVDPSDNLPDIIKLLDSNQVMEQFQDIESNDMHHLWILSESSQMIFKML
jgi:hypothetical protein